MTSTARDESAIKQAISRLSRAMDSQDAEAMSREFEPGGSFTVNGVDHVGLEGFARIAHRHGTAIVKHHTGQTLIDLAGDFAVARSFALRMHIHIADVPARSTPSISWVGYVRDELRKHGSGWSFVKRTEFPWAGDVLKKFAQDEGDTHGSGH